MKQGPHAMIFVSKDPHYNRQEAKELAEETTPYKENIYWVESDGLSVKDKTIEELLNRLSFKPLIGDRKVAIIDDADSITERAQNRLLKTLEEPLGNVLIILLSENEENLLPTVRSRCGIYRLNAGYVGKQVSETNRKIARELLENKPYYNFIESIKEPSATRIDSIDFLDDIKIVIKEILFDKGEYEKAHRLISIIEQGEQDIKSHVRRDYALKHIILKILEDNSL